ncbi:MAG: hypothetical protein IJ730_03395 [Alphaproteobacteria bacterium]|nr:hypothetical protein [Alphaproteobacteria bacterium]
MTNFVKIRLNFPQLLIGVADDTKNRNEIFADILGIRCDVSSENLIIALKEF